MTRKTCGLFPDELTHSYLETEHAVKFDSFTRHIRSVVCFLEFSKTEGIVTNLRRIITIIFRIILLHQGYISYCWLRRSPSLFGFTISLHSQQRSVIIGRVIFRTSDLNSLIALLL